VLFPVRDARLGGRIRREILSAYLADRAAARRLLPDGTYRRLRGQGEPAFSAQEALVRVARGEAVDIPDAFAPAEAPGRPAAPHLPAPEWPPIPASRLATGT
jgi:hypothetical protein